MPWRVDDAWMRQELQDAADPGDAILAHGYGYQGPSPRLVVAVSGIVLLLGLLTAAFTARSWWFALASVVVAAAVYGWLWKRVKFCLVGVSRKHFIVIDLRGREPLPPARLGLSSIQYPRIIEKEITHILRYNLGDGTLNFIKFTNLPGMPTNRDACQRIYQAILANI